MTELFLWDHPVSSYSQKVRIALREKNIPFKFETPRGTGSGILANTDPKFVESNHRLEVPTLVDGYLKIFDSTIILEYLEDKYPDVPLRALNAAGRARARMIEDVCDSQYEAINWGLGEITVFKRAEGELAETMKAKAAEQIKQIQAWLTEQLGNAPWFGGDTFGYADVCAWPFVNRSGTYGLEPKAGSPLGDWCDRAKQRPSVRLTNEEVQANVKGMSLAAEYVQKGLLIREYRDSRLEWMIKSGGIDVVRDGIEKKNIRFMWPS